MDTIDFREASKFAKSFTSKYSSTSCIEEMWKEIKTNLSTIVNICVPSINDIDQISISHGLNLRTIKRLSRRRKREALPRPEVQDQRNDINKYKKLKK